MHDRIRTKFFKKIGKFLIVLGNIDDGIVNPVSRDFFPRLYPDVDWFDRSQAADAEFKVDPPARQVVQDGDVMTDGRKMQGRWPTTKSVSAKHKYFFAVHIGGLFF